MDVSQAIRTRRSIRKYKQETVPHEVIESIVADAAYAPSWKNTQIARYILVEDRATIDKMAEEMVLDFKFNEKTLKSCAALMVLTYITGRSGFERDGSYATPKEAGFEMFDAMVAAIREQTARTMMRVSVRRAPLKREQLAKPSETPAGEGGRTVRRESRAQIKRELLGKNRELQSKNGRRWQA